MPRIRKLLERAKQCYAQANGTLNPEAKNNLRKMGEHYIQEADEVRRTEIIPAAFPNEKKFDT